MTRIKISGLTHPEDASLATELGVDLVACVFNAQSPRYVTITQAWAVKRSLGPGIRLAGVFVDTPPPLVERVAEACQLDLVQLFGAATRAELEALSIPAFKAVTVGDAEALDAAVRGYGLTGRRAKRPDGPGLLVHLTGAIGSAWDVVAPHSQRVPLILAATGLTPDSVATAIGLARPWGVDVWDVVEREPGRLDPALVRSFVDAVRRADRQSGPSPHHTEERPT